MPILPVVCIGDYFLLFINKGTIASLLKGLG